MGLIFSTLLKRSRFGLVSCVLCASVTNANELKSTVQDIPTVDHLQLFLSNYLGQNLLDRTDISRRLIDRAELEEFGRFPSKSLYKSLGYRLRHSFVAMPPPLQSKPYASNEDVLRSKELEDLELTWAMLDSTLFRLRSEGIGRNQDEDWAIAVTRKNLLQEGVNYWYQLGRQSNYSQWLLTLKRRTNDIFDGISQARQNYDVQDLQDQELVLLDLRADNAAMFQYFSSEQARLYNRTGERDIPEEAVAMTNRFEAFRNCPADRRLWQQGQAYLNRHHLNWGSLNTDSSANSKAVLYELSVLARTLSSQALKLHANRSTRASKRYQQELANLTEQKNAKISLLQEVHNQLKAQGQPVDEQEISRLTTQTIELKERASLPTSQERQLSAAIMVVADNVASKILSLAQQRIATALNKQQPLFAFSKVETWNRSSNDAQLVRALLLSVHELSFLDFLIAHERAAFVNLLMHRGCAIADDVQSFSMGTPLAVMADVANVAGNYRHSGFDQVPMLSRTQEFQKLALAMNPDELGKGYELPLLTEMALLQTSTSDSAMTRSRQSINSETAGVEAVADSSEEEVKKNLSAAQAKKRLAKYDVKLATKSEVLKATEGKGYTLQIVTAPEEYEIGRVLHQLVFEEPSIVYRSQRPSSKEVVYKLIIGFSPNYDEIKELRRQLKRGWIKPFEMVRKDILD